MACQVTEIISEVSSHILSFPHFSLKFWKGLFLEKVPLVKECGGSPFFTVHEDKGAEAEILVCPVNMMKTPFRRQTWMHQLKFIPEYKQYLGSGSLGTNTVCIKWRTPITSLHICQQAPREKLLAQVLVMLCAAEEVSNRDPCQGSH